MAHSTIAYVADHTRWLDHVVALACSAWVSRGTRRPPPSPKQAAAACSTLVLCRLVTVACASSRLLPSNCVQARLLDASICRQNWLPSNSAVQAGEGRCPQNIQGVNSAERGRVGVCWCVGTFPRRRYTPHTQRALTQVGLQEPACPVYYTQWQLMHTLL